MWARGCCCCNLHHVSFVLHPRPLLCCIWLLPTPVVSPVREKLRTYVSAGELGKRGFLFPFAPSWRFTVAEASTHSPSMRADALWSDEWIDRRCATILVRKVRVCMHLRA